MCWVVIGTAMALMSFSRSPLVVALSFADGIKTQDGDEFEIEAALFGRAIRNRLKTQAERKVVIKTI